VAYFPDSTAFRLGLKTSPGPDSLFTAVLVDRNGDWPADFMDWITWANTQVTSDPFLQSYSNLSYGSEDGAFLAAWNDWRIASLDAWSDPMPPADIYGQRLWLEPG